MADLYLSVGAGDAHAGNNHGANCYGSAWESGTDTGGNYSTVSWAISADYYCNSGWTWGGTSRPSAGYLDMVINDGVNDSVVGTMTLPINRGWGNGTGIGSQSGSLNIEHNADGTGSFSFYIRVRTGDDPRGGGVVYNSGSSNTAWKGLSTIPRASQPSTSTNSPTAGVAFTVYTNRKSSSFSHTIYYEIRYDGNNGTHVQAASGVGDSVSITVPESVFDSAGNYSSLSCRILCDTYSESTKIGDTKYTDTVLYANSDMEPTISSASVSETNRVVSSKGSNITVRYLSRKTVTCKINAEHGASVSSVTASNGNLTVSMSNSNGIWTSNNMTNLQTGTYLITVIDSRGLKATQQINETYHAYAYPSVTGGADRTTSTGSDGTLKINGTYWNGLNNTASITYQRNTESSSHALSATPSNGGISGSVSYSDLNYQTAYSWDVIITDGFGETVRSTIGLPVSIPIFFIGKNNVYVNGKTLLNLTYPVGSIYMSVNSTSPATLFGGTWEEITGRFLLAHDGSHPAASTGGEYSTTLTGDAIPAHNHYYNSYQLGYPSAFVEIDNYKTPVVSIQRVKNGGYPDNSDGVEFTGTTTYGQSKAHNNTPPYLSVYMWKRTG